MDPTTEPRGQRIQHLAPGPGDGHGRALRVQRLRDGVADAPGCAGNQCRPASQIEHHRALAQAICAAASASFAKTMSLGPPTEIPTAPSAMRLTRPLNTLPAPISKNRVTPRLAM